ncbi:unnamed protein product [Spodoptera exigua]|nr:unnamed protein product [Spodoptera exigua]
MYSLKGSPLGTCMETIAGVHKNGICLDGLPQYICYQCAPILMNCHKLIEKCMFSQTVLLDIFVKNGQITKSLIEEKNKTTDSISASASTEELNNYLVKCDEINSSPFTPDYCDIYFKDENTNHIDSRSYTILGANCKVETDGEEFCENFDLEDDGTSLVQSIGSSKANMGEDKKIKSKKYTKKEVTTPKKSKGLTPDESSMLKYFDIVQLSLQEQIEEWQKSAIRRTLTSETVYQCKICKKTFANSNSYQLHINYHDPGLGQYECPVCKLRFKSATLSAAHRKRAHSKKFFCKTCPKSFNNVNVAKKHSRWHSGYEYRCPRCAFVSVHESALCAHRRRVHGPAHGCVHCGRHYSTARGLSAHKHAAHAQADDKDISKEYRCEECNINFASEGARRVHLLTSSQHKNKSSLCDSTTDPILRNCCNKCGVECNSFKDLLVHMRSSHPRSRRSDQPWKGDTPYPLDCELCGERISCRKKHWFHVRRRHPMHVDSYQPIITVICDTCGKGFQNSTKLRIHQLRHSTPKVRCAHCPRLFYDKYALNRHAQTHSEDKPHQCRTCGRAFKLLSNLERHARLRNHLVVVHVCAVSTISTMENLDLSNNKNVSLSLIAEYGASDSDSDDTETRSNDNNTDSDATYLTEMVLKNNIINAYAHGPLSRQSARDDADVSRHMIIDSVESGVVEYEVTEYRDVDTDSDNESSSDSSDSDVDSVKDIEEVSSGDEAENNPRTGKPEPPKVNGEMGLDDLPPIEDLAISLPAQDTTKIGTIVSIVDRLADCPTVFRIDNSNFTFRESEIVALQF